MPCSSINHVARSFSLAGPSWFTSFSHSSSERPVFFFMPAITDCTIRRLLCSWYFQLTGFLAATTHLLKTSIGMVDSGKSYSRFVQMQTQLFETLPFTYHSAIILARQHRAPTSQIQKSRISYTRQLNAQLAFQAM